MKRMKRIILLLLLLTAIYLPKQVLAIEELDEEYTEVEEEEVVNEEILINNSLVENFKIVFISLIGLGFVILVAGTLNKKEPSKDLSTPKVDLSKLNDNIDDINLKEKIFNLYKDFQTSRTKNSLTKLKPLVTEKLYPKYELEINKNKTNKQKNVITDILSKDIKIISIEERNNQKYINVYLYVTQYDYTLDSDKKVIKGTNESKYQVEYDLEILYQEEELLLENIKCTGKWISK